MKSTTLKKKPLDEAKLAAYIRKATAAERAEFPSDEQLARTGQVVEFNDRRAPAAIRVISKLVAMWGSDRVTRHVIRWPDGIVSVVQGDLSTEKSRREKLPWAYHIAFGKLLEKSLKFIDYQPGAQA